MLKIPKMTQRTDRGKQRFQLGRRNKILNQLNILVKADQSDARLRGSRRQYRFSERSQPFLIYGEIRLRSEAAAVRDNQRIAPLY